MDPIKAKVLEDWLVPTSITEIRSFMGLASFYRRFIKKFGTITECLKSKKISWIEEADKGFILLRKEPVVALPDIDKLFEVELDASIIVVGAVLSQENHPLAYFCGKLAECRRK